MKLRIFIEPQQGADYATQARVALATEELGFDAFFRSDHFLAMGDGDGLPGPTDSWVTLGALALQTSRIRLGTMVTAATFRLPGPLAIAVAQVDQMSGGRVDFGLGTGWFEAEHTAYGIPFPSLGERFDRFEEQLAVITGLWETPEGQTFSYAGTHYQLTDSPALPKPAQRRERDAVGGVLGLVPAGPDTEVDPAAAQLVDLGHGDGQRPGQPEGGRGDHGAEPDAPGLQGQRAQRHPRVGRTRQAPLARHGQEVIGPEERVEAEIFGGHRDPGQGRVVSTGLWLSENPQFHWSIQAWALVRLLARYSLTRVARHSTWWVMGKASKARRASSRQPCGSSNPMSRAKVAGSQDT